ncbi:3-oxoacyl-[acyl-carrier-protein] synthase III C-terminal domain-containing protein [Mycobacteroides abscessus]|uniref:3-oxoacyl-[acyl-carrier-protein] synthase III C-terminal domain-containing protein n=1 Tax=Mycobacteroides abscessus TaxID=36809 RepID=UPI0013F5A012|nr:3-oxoacyl-[acyl-carrier-protein] synthase III C-terminal domain-containing protein [Mycobacteroides abscessus]
MSTSPGNVVIESLGTALPTEVVSTEEILAGCLVEIPIPLERLTGIRNRRVSGEGEYSIDLARTAAMDCLDRSAFSAEAIDLVISCSVARCDAPQRFTYEPSTAARLSRMCGLVNAISFDISNACAGMFTGIAVAESFLRTGQVKNALIVSGEYISHLASTAQQELRSPTDTRIACLTLGDAGAAVIVKLSPDNKVGFHDIDMATLGRYSSLSIGKVSSNAHGGAIMTLAPMENSAGIVQRAVPYAAKVMQRRGWLPEECDHIIMHQTSKTTINDAVAGINRIFGHSALHPGNVVNNLLERGNTASNTHFVCLADQIQTNRIRNGDRIVFGISGAGQTVGAALYTLDDLPERYRHRRSKPHPKAVEEAGAGPVARTKNNVVITSIGVTNISEPGTHQPSIPAAIAAATSCLRDSGVHRDDLGLIIHVGVYRDEYLHEPAIAAFIAGALEANDDIDTPDGRKTFAFDLVNGSIGLLNACQTAIQFIRSGKSQYAIIVASETENNAVEPGRNTYGLSQTGTAILLRSTDEKGGFGDFSFGHFGEYEDALATHTYQTDGKSWLEINRVSNVEDYYLACIPPTVEKLFSRNQLKPTDIAVVFPPFLSDEARAKLAGSLGIPIEDFVDAGVGGDTFTSTLALQMKQAQKAGRVKPGMLGLLISVGSGLQVGCTTYRF